MPSALPSQLSRFIASIPVIALLAAHSPAAAQQKPAPNFPTDDEIRLVLTQAKRAIGQYKPLLDMEEKMLGKTGAEAIAKDREVVHAIDTAIEAFGKNPQAFNGPLGFALFEWIDDAGRNALLSSVKESSDSTVDLIDGDTQKARANADLANEFANISTVFYTVSENAGALYARYVEGEEQLAKEGLRVATDCADALKKTNKPGSKP